MAGRGRDALSAPYWFAVAAFVGSAATVDKYAGHWGAAAYLVALMACAPLGYAVLGRARQLIDERTAVWLAVSVLLVLLVVFAVVYPHANAATPGSGSDRDDAADVGVRALLDGRSPYSAHTYLGNSVSQLPGGLLLAVPFVVIGHSAYAAFVWLPVLFLALRSLAGESRTPLLLVCAALAVSPVFPRELLTGGDLIANTAAVTAAAVALVAALAGARPWLAAGAAVAVGVALSWRLNFAFVLPPLLALLAARHGARVAVGTGALVAAAFAAVTLPFYLPDRHGFTPIAASDKLAGFNGAIPGGARSVLAVALVLSLALAVLRRPEAVAGVLGQTAVVQAFFLLVVAALVSAQARGLDLLVLTPGYGLTVLLLALAPLAAAGLPGQAAEGTR